MFRDWYDDYLRAIYPRNAALEIEYAFPELTIQALIETALAQFEIFNTQVLSVSSKELEQSISSQLIVEPLVEFLGAIKTKLLANDLHRETQESAIALIKSFEELIQNESDKILILFENEVKQHISESLSVWQELVNMCLSSECSPNFFQYWNTKTKELVVYDGQEDYETFVKRIQSSSILIKTIDYWDYLDGLAHRYSLARTLQLSENYCQIIKEQQELKTLDNLLKPLLAEDNQLLADEVKKYYPKYYYWWYYNSPKNVFLFGRE